jgi:hypothetical protein
MKTTITNTFFFLVLVTTLLNCKGKKGDPGPSGSAGPVSSGSINGIVTLTSSNGTQLLDMSGVTVKTNKGDSVITNTAGVWSLNEVTGIYTITFTKPGFGTNTVAGYNFAGGGNSYITNVSLSQIPSYSATMTLDTIAGNSSTTKDLKMNVNLAITGATGQAQDMEFFVYYSTNSGVSSSNYMGMISIVVPAAQTSFKGSISGVDFLNAGIQPGQIANVIVYSSSASAALSSKYVNESTGKIIYTSLGQPSLTQSLTVPH